MDTFTNIGPAIGLTPKRIVPVDVSTSRSNDIAYPYISEDGVNLEFDNIQPKHANITLDQYASTDVPLFEPATVKYVATELFSRKKTVVITMALLTIFVLFIILMSTDVVSTKIAIPLIVISLTTIVGIFWFHIIPFIKLLRAVMRDELRSVHHKGDL